MSAPPSPSMFKPGYEGAQPVGRANPAEVGTLQQAWPDLVQRLHTAMLVLSSWDDQATGSPSNMPAYIHEFSDVVGWDPRDQPTPRLRFDPTPAQASDALKALALLDGLRRVYQQVLFLRAIGEHYGGGSWASIGERFDRSPEWAQRSYEAVVIQAARRAGILDPEPKGWCILVASVNHAGWRTFVTTAGDPATQLRDLRAKNALAIDEAYAFWVAGPPVAKRLIATLRKNLLGQKTHGSWHMVSPDALADQLIQEAQKIGASWSILELRAGSRGAGPRSSVLRDGMRDALGISSEALAAQAAEAAEDQD